ncbi:hypothetical protein GCM10009722_41130 [Williamsia deligens]|nr:hypothetical protein [Williamsia deligens]
MRDRIARAVASPKCSPRDLASLTKRLADLAGEIAELDATPAAVNSERVRALEEALRQVAPTHPLLTGVPELDERFDASAV